jgi:protein-tyrosine phosphatase
MAEILKSRPFSLRGIYLSLCTVPGIRHEYGRKSARTIVNAGRIIALCKGNTCRSPFLAACLQNAAAESGLSLPPILSCGLLKAEGDPSSAVAIASARKFGVDLSGHRSTSIHSEVPDTRDVLLVMDPAHVEELTNWNNVSVPKVIYIGLLDSERPSAVVEDPYGNDEAVYDRIYARLARATAGLIADLK